jgi:PAS domain S-box-containing protein
MDTSLQGSQPEEGWVERELMAMAGRLEELRNHGGDVSSVELVAELETAMEELRVTGEEVAAQQRHISDLLRETSLAQATVQRLVATMPTPVLMTDLHGALLEVNSAASRLLGVAPERLRGKPLAAFVDVADRRAVRTMVLEAAQGGTPEPAVVQMTPRGDGRQRATLVAVPAPDGDSSAAPTALRWFADVTAQGDGAAAGLALLGSFAELLALPPAQAHSHGLVPRILGIAERALPEAADLTINVGDPRNPAMVSSTSAQGQAADAAQLEAGEGPCVQAFLTDQVVCSNDLRNDARWPVLARRLGDLPVNVSLGVPLDGETGVLGVLNLYAAEGKVLDDGPIRARAELFARAASSLLEDSQRVELLREEARHLRQALVSRPEIDQAKGILMARFGYTADDAFRHLVAVSQKRNVKLRDIARDIVSRVQRGHEPTGTGG